MLSDELLAVEVLYVACSCVYWQTVVWYTWRVGEVENNLWRCNCAQSWRRQCAYNSPL